MAIEIYKRLNYLNEITEKLVELEPSSDALRLTSFYGLTTKEICYKNLVKSFRWDKIKLKRCPRCHAHIDFNLERQFDRKSRAPKNDTENNGQLAKGSKSIYLSDSLKASDGKINFKIKRKRLLIQCNQCKFTKSFAINSQYKTIYEKLYANYLSDNK